jgi:hypothetical protein
MTDEPVPQLGYRVTSRRPPWVDLPPAVRAAVADAAGACVVAVGAPVTSGFSGGFAAVARLGDGREVFAKAGSGANPHLLEAYAREAVVLAGLPDVVPAPRFVGSARVEADGVPGQVVVADVVRGRILSRDRRRVHAPERPAAARPGATPAIRVHQRRYARTFLDWLGARRGWVTYPSDELAL